MPSRKSILPLAAAAVAATLALIPCAAAAQDELPPPAEEVRLDRGEFLDGLKKRGLDEMLDLHLKDFPPQEQSAHLLLARERLLARFYDAGLTAEERGSAIAEANRLLERLVEAEGQDPRRFNWQFTLAHSLLYDEAEPLFTSILYRGGSEEDLRRLRPLTERAVAAVDSLIARLQVEYNRLDTLPVERFTPFERSGYVEEIDALGPRAEYLRLWALFYDSLSRAENDPTRATALHAIRDYFASNADVLDTPHDASRVQVQASLLGGMTKRRLHNHSSARLLFDRAVSVADRLSDPAERRRVQWAVILAWIERIRNEQDDGNIEDALRALSGFRERIAAEFEDNFGLTLVAALLERSIHRTEAEALALRGRATGAARHAEQAWGSLARLAQQNPQRRHEIYAALYDLIAPEADPETLDPYEQCALLAGLLTEDSGDAGDAAGRLDRAAAVAERFLAHPAPGADALVPEVLYNLAVVEYRRGRIAEAARRFHEVAQQHPSFDNALQAANFAVQLSSRLFEDLRLRDHPQVQALYLDTLSGLVTGFKDSGAAGYWRFYYAQLLDELGRPEEAATQYALVPSGHEHHLEAMFLRVRSLAQALEASPDETEGVLLDIRRRADSFLAVQRDFVTRANGERTAAGDAEEAARIKSFVARSHLLVAETQVMPAVGRHAQALETLAGFEEQYPEETAVTGRVWRVRLLAYEKLGRLDEAARAVPAYVTADPANAGPTLQALYLGLAEESDLLRASGDDRAAQQKAEVAHLLAGEIAAWDAQHNAQASAPEHRSVEVQLAEAHLRAGLAAEARQRFEALRAGGASAREESDVRVAFGYAEALFQLREFDAALPRFNALAVELPPEDPLRWRALLRDLQCRTALGAPPAGIIQVIRQQEHLYPDLGGPVLAGEFERLQRENQRRHDRG